jgi:hypothetical protein
MSSDNLDGVMNPKLSISVTPPAGLGVATDFLGILDAKFPKRAFKKANYISQGGDTAHLEQVRAGSALADSLSATLLLDPTTLAALEAAAGINGCDISAIATGVGTWTGTGFIEVVDIEKFDDSKQVQATVTVNFNAGWTFTPDTGALIVVPAYAFKILSSTTRTLDLTACGATGDINLNGKKITRLSIKAIGTNANAITLAAGNFVPAATYSVTLSAGEADDLRIPAALAATVATSSACTLTLTGTATPQGIIIQIEAVTP